MLSKHEALSRELAASLRSLGDIRAFIITTFSQAWRENSGVGVTERRETCKEATSHWAAEEAKLLGEIEALRVELNHVELQLRHADPER